MEIWTAFQNTLGHIKPQTSPEVQAEAARGVAERLLGHERAAKFLMVVNPDLGPTGLDTFLVNRISRYNCVQISTVPWIIVNSILFLDFSQYRNNSWQDRSYNFMLWYKLKLKIQQTKIFFFWTLEEITFSCTFSCVFGCEKNIILVQYLAHFSLLLIAFVNHSVRYTIQ